MPVRVESIGKNDNVSLPVDKSEAAARSRAKRVRSMDIKWFGDPMRAYASLISDRDRAKDVEHFLDFLRTFINEISKTRAVSAHSETRRKRVQPRGWCLLKHMFRGSTMSYGALIRHWKQSTSTKSTPPKWTSEWLQRVNSTTSKDQEQRIQNWNWSAKGHQFARRKETATRREGKATADGVGMKQRD